MPPFVSTSALVVDGERLLVVLDPVRGEPVLPGGHLKWREAPEGAVVREVREETGYEIRPRALVGVFAGEDWSGEPGIVRIVYQADIVGGSLRSSHEGEAKWISLRELTASSTRDAPLVQLWLERCGDNASRI
jgi:ADP-ribose pyrophosphatase YjhB (NUDIX family)